MAAPDIIQRAYNYFVSRGYAPHQAAAIVGNMRVESSGNPTIVGDSGKAFGSFQLHPPRQAGLDRFVRDENMKAYTEGREPTANRNDPETQWAHKIREWETTEKAAGDRLRAARTVQEANDAMLSDLRPGGYKPGDPTGSNAYDTRMRYSLEAAGMEPGAYVGRHDLPVTAAAGNASPGNGVVTNALAGPDTGWGSKSSIDTLASVGSKLMNQGQGGAPAAGGTAGVPAAPDPGVFQPQLQQPGFFNAYRQRAGLLGGAK